MSDIERTMDHIEDTKTQKENIAMETNGQLRIVFDEDTDDKNEVVEEITKEVEDISHEQENEKEVWIEKTEDDRDPNQDELYKFDPETEHYRDR